MPHIRIKTCGLKNSESLQAAADADFIGFIFFEKSPRYITPVEAGKLRALAKGKVVAVTVNPSDALLDEIAAHVNPDYIQLHGSETPERAQEIKAKYGKPIIKAFSISCAQDLDVIERYNDVADIFLFDAKSSGELPGGNGVSFDWTILAGKNFDKPWFISGGIRLDNVEKALHISGAQMVDISSGLESSPGVKDIKLIKDFIHKVKTL